MCNGNEPETARVEYNENTTTPTHWQLVIVVFRNFKIVTDWFLKIIFVVLKFKKNIKNEKVCGL